MPFYEFVDGRKKKRAGNVTRRHVFRQQSSGASCSSVIMMFEPNTCDAVVVFRDERLPRRGCPSRLATAPEDPLARVAQAYVAVSRARSVYVGLSLGYLPEYHRALIEG